MAQKKFVFIITHAYSRPDLVAGAFQLAVNMKAFDADIVFFLMDEGALLAKKGLADSVADVQKKDEFSPMNQLLKTLVDDFGVKFYICASCVKHYGLDKAELIQDAEVRPGSFLGEMLMEREGLTF